VKKTNEFIKMGFEKHNDSYTLKDEAEEFYEFENENKFRPSSRGGGGELNFQNFSKNGKY